MTTITQVITALPTAPDPATMSPSVFSTAAAASVLAQKAMTPELNTLASQINVVAGEASASNAAAAAQATTATTQAGLAAASAATAQASANYKGAYASRTGAAAVPYSVSHLGKYWQLTSNLADVTLKVPGTDPEWIVIGGGTSWVRKTTTYTAASGEGIFADTTAGAFTTTLPGAPSAGDTIPFIDAAGTWATNNLTIGRNGLKIMGLAEDLICDIKNGAFDLVYDNATNGWRIK